MDHPGIVHRISAFLAERRINIRALDTRVTNAPVTAWPSSPSRRPSTSPPPERDRHPARAREDRAEENIDIEINLPGEGGPDSLPEDGMARAGRGG